jgi:carbamoyltransferase
MWSTSGTPVFGRIFSDKRVKLLGPVRTADEPLTQRHYDIAHSVQAMYEEAFFNLLNTLHAKYDIDNLALAGGCAMNSVANGKVYRHSPFKQCYVQSAAGDAGGAIGAAFVAWHQEQARGKNVKGKDKGEARDVMVSHRGVYLHGRRGVSEETEAAYIEQEIRSNRGEGAALTDRFVMDHAYWGPSYNNDQISTVLDDNGDRLAEEECNVDLLEETELCYKTAEAIADGNVIGWFQGRMELGSAGARQPLHRLRPAPC